MAGKRSTKAGKAAAMSRSLTKVQKAEVKKIVARAPERKYVVDPTILDNGIVVPSSIVTNTDVIPLIPAIAAGSGQNQRNGDQIQDAVLKVHWRFWLPPEATVTQLFKVKLFILESKRLKSDLGRTATTDLGRLLNNGDGTMVDWAASSGLQNLQNDMMPVNTQDWTVKSIKSFHLVKNADWVNGGGGASAPANVGQLAVHSLTTTFKIGTLRYDGIASTSPTNHFYAAYLVAFSDNNSTATAQPFYSMRPELYYKDP